MAFIEKYKSNTQKINIVRPEDISALYENTFRCPYCYIVPAFNLNLDLDTILIVKVTCNCGEKEFEINDFLNIYGKDFRGNLQCNSCKEFATKNNTVFKFCLGCEQFYCAECQYDHMVKEENTYIDFRDVGSICKEHKIYYQAFCKKCHKNICKYCYNSHAQHKVVNYNSLYISDLEMVDLNSNYGKVQLTVLFKDTETKETIHNLLKDVDELNKNYITELFDANKQKNQYILQYFKTLLTLYNNTVHKTYNIIMNIRNNICYNTSSFDINPDTKMDDNTLLNKFYLYAKNHCIAKKPKPFKEKYEKIDSKKNIIKSEMDDDYQEILDNIDYYLNIIKRHKEILDDGIEVQIQSPFKYNSFIYFGEFSVEKNIPHGSGILIYKNGDKYYGMFQNGKKNIAGIYYFKKNGGRYEGEWKDNKMNGYGKYFYPNGTIYEGYFKDNIRDGVGILTTSKGDVYKTIWKGGNVSDYGRIIYHDGKNYEGYIHNYQKHSCGILTYPNGDKFIGNFKEDNFSVGHYQYKNGNSYFGYYNEFNQKHGYGKFKYLTIGEVYEGYFANDKRQGIGRYFYSNGDIYTGYLYDDLRNGFGIIKFNNGDWYEGMFVKDIRHGIGIYYEKKGDEYYLGEWVEDKKEGVATIYNQNWYYNGEVKNGVREGLCTFIYGDNIYTGAFKDNMWEGIGTLIIAEEGKLIEGLFKKGQHPKKKEEKENKGKDNKNKNNDKDKDKEKDKRKSIFDDYEEL